VYDEFTFSDLCPFTTGTWAGLEQYCFVFSDHPQFPTVSSFLSARLPGTYDWTGTTFYYVPFTLQALGQIVLNLNVVNTLLTNSMFGNGTLLTPTNYETFGPAVSLVARHIMALIAADPAAEAELNGVYDSSVPLSTVALQRLYTVIEGYRSADGTRYTFISTSDTSTTSTVVLAASEVVPTFFETNTVITYANVVVTSAVAGVAVTVATSSAAVVNQVSTCTRFQIDGSGIVISGIRFDQSKCTLTGTMQQTPIVFSGTTASGCVVRNVTVVDSSAAVAVLGGDSLVFG
jgi:hypothetical protein